MNALTHRGPHDNFSADLLASAGSPCPIGTAGARPPDFVMFMANTLEAAPNGGGTEHLPILSAHRLHVLATGDYLIVTEADELHEPGRCVSALRLMTFRYMSMFRLLDAPAPGVDQSRHFAVAGTAILSVHHRQRRLTGLGFTGGAPANRDILFDAIELGLG